MAEASWYENLRETWKPTQVRLLLIGEAPPDDGGDTNSRRFFYAEPLTQYDNLFRAIVAALYDSGKLTKGEAKGPWLRRLLDDGVYLIDLAVTPVNGLLPGARQRILKASVQDCVRRAVELDPEGIVICHAPSFVLLSEALKAAGLHLLHETAIPFPLGNHRSEFVDSFRSAIAELA